MYLSYTAWRRGSLKHPFPGSAPERSSPFCPGEHCRFCRGKAQCKARADIHTAVEEFKDCVPEAKAEPGQNTLTNAQIGDLLVRCADLVSWYKRRGY